MHIQTTQRRLWLLAAMITSLATGQAYAQGKVDIRQKKQVDRAGLPITIRQSASKDAASGLTRQVAPARALRVEKLKDDGAKVITRQQASVDHVRNQDGGLRKTDSLGQDSASTIVSQEDIERLRMIEAILDIRELYELDSLIGRDLANTHGDVMNMIDAALQAIMDIIAASTRSMSGVGLAEDRAAYTRGTIFGWLSGVLADLHNAAFGGKDYLNDMDGDGLPDNMDDDMDGDGIKNEDDDDIDGDGVKNEDDAFPRDDERSITAESEVWLLSEGTPRELFDEFVYQWLVSDMNRNDSWNADLDMLMRLAIEGWMTEY
jgi:hypothetical protein